MKISFFILMGFLMITPVFAQDAGSAHWEFAGWYGGGCFPNIAFDPQNKDRVYLTSDVAGIWRSDDLGEHWYFITKGLGQLKVSQVAIAPSDSNVLYAATGGGIYVSTNAGASWTAAADTADKAITFIRPENYRPVAIDPQNPDKLCVGTAKGEVFCSKDAGKQWEDIDPKEQFFSDKKPIAALSFDGPDRLMVASSKGLSHCSLKGNTCEAISNGPGEITDFLFSGKFPKTIYAAGSNTLWVSKDDGISWNKSQPIPKGNIYRVALYEGADKPVIDVIWNKGWKGGVLSTKDEGQTWEEKNDNLEVDAVSDPTYLWASKDGKATGIQVDPFNGNVIFRLDWWGVWRSDDGGDSWHQKVVGAPNTVASQVVVASNGDVYVASMDNGLLRSHDGGKTYECLFPRKYSDATAGHVWRIAVEGQNIIGTSSPWNKRTNQVIISTDGGNTFDLVHAGLPEGRPKKNTMWGQGYPRAFAVDPKNPDIIYLGIDGDDGGGLFISKDRGHTWQRSQGQPGSLRSYRALAVDPTDSNRIFWGGTGKAGGVYVSEDAGKTFQDTNLRQTRWPFDLAIASDGVVYVAADSSGAKLFASTDHGHGWKKVGDFGKDRTLATVAVDPLNPQRIVVSTVSWGNDAPCKIFMSHDGAKTWEDITGDLPDGAGASSIAFDPQSQYLYIARYAGSVYKMKL